MAGSKQPMQQGVLTDRPALSSISRQCTLQLPLLTPSCSSCLGFFAAIELASNQSLPSVIPTKSLFTFDRTPGPILPPGTSHIVNVTVADTQLALVGSDGSTWVHAGKYKLMLRDGTTQVEQHVLLASTRTIDQVPLPPLLSAE